MIATQREIGPAGTGLRVTVALGLLYLAGCADARSWTVAWLDVALGLVALPALTVLLAVAANRRDIAPVRFTGPLGHALNCALIVALVANPYTSGAAALFYATTIFVAAWRGQPGCELTVVPNWLVRRDDQVGCPVFWPIDALEARHQTARPAAAHE